MNQTKGFQHIYIDISSTPLDVLVFRVMTAFKTSSAVTCLFKHSKSQDENSQLKSDSVKLFVCSVFNRDNQAKGGGH